MDGAVSYKVYLGEQEITTTSECAEALLHSHNIAPGTYNNVTIEGYDENAGSGSLVGEYEVDVNLTITEDNSSMDNVSFSWWEYNVQGETIYPYAITGLPEGWDECIIFYSDTQNFDGLYMTGGLYRAEDGSATGSFSADDLNETLEDYYTLRVYDNLTYTDTSASWTVYTSHDWTNFPAKTENVTQ